MEPIKSETNLRSYDIDHSGRVAGIIDEMGLVEEINEVRGNHRQEVMSSGIAIKAMLLKPGQKT